MFGKAIVVNTEKETPVAKPSANVTLPGIIGKASVLSTNSKNSTWIIDTGASDHMTKEFGQLQSILSSPQTVISTANGSTSPVTGEGPVTLSKILTLDIVLVVSSLEYNLLSISQITSKLSCTMTFWPSYCVFQDIRTQKILGYGVKRGKLYYLDLTKDETPKANNSINSGGVDKARTAIWLWH